MLDLNDLQSAVQALQIYIQDVQSNIEVMNKAATDCMDNMGSDIYSEKAASKLQECVKSLSLTIEEAYELHGKILKKISDIEESQNIL